MRILITGGAGFVGSSLALHLRQACSDAAVVCMDNLYRRGSELNVPRLQKAGSLCEFTALCAEITGKKIPISSLSLTRPNDLRIFVADCTRLFEKTEWRPKRDVRWFVQDINDWVTSHSTELEQL